MTETTQPAVIQPATILATIEETRARSGVTDVHSDDFVSRTILLRGAMGASVEGLTTQRGERVEVAQAPSALAVWDAIDSWTADGWLVMVTDREDADLGSGTLALVAQHRVQSPDPWESVKQRFGARELDRRLLRSGHNPRQLAEGLLMAEMSAPAAGSWPKAPTGVLTRDHALGSVAVRCLGLPEGPVDGQTVLEWVCDAGVPAKIVALRTTAGDDVTDATLEWLAERTGDAQGVVGGLLSQGHVDRLLPLGVAVNHLVVTDGALRHEAEMAYARLEYRMGEPRPSKESAAAFGVLSDKSVRSLLENVQTVDKGRAILHDAEQLLRHASAPGVIAASKVLPGGLTSLYRRLTEALGNRPDDVEDLWLAINQHPLDRNRSGSPGDLHSVAEAAVRLDRWLDADHPVPEGTTVEVAAGLASDFVRDGAWAESARNVLLRGATDARISAGFARLADRVSEARKTRFHAFASRISPIARGDSLSQGVVYLEDVLATVGMPLAKNLATEGGLLVLLLDGMAASTAAGIVQGILEETDAWSELVPTDQRSRITGLSMLPSITEFSRTSFFCGRAKSGGQAAENQGFAALVSRAGQGNAVLFHKAELDDRAPGVAIARPIADAIADVHGHRIVGCVLNTIDDALDKADPGGMEWTVASVKHLRPLLLAAARAGRTVLLTADHGHVVERGSHTGGGEPTSARSRVGESGDAGTDEVYVEGPRVLPHGKAVLAVDEDLRYVSRHAGYHGGAALPEVAVPVIVLHPRMPVASLNPTADVADQENPVPSGWQLAVDQKPAWWGMRLVGSHAPREAAAASPESAQPDLFTRELPEPDVPETQLGAAVVGTDTYSDQKILAPRTAPSDDAAAAALNILAAARGHRVPATELAAPLGVTARRVDGAVTILSQLVNVEGYPVLRRDGDLVVLDEPLLRKQFGLGEIDSRERGSRR